MPEHMPADSYFNTHETDPIAAQVICLCKCDHSGNIKSPVCCFCVPLPQSHFWARTRNWMFAAWRDEDIAALDVDKSNSLKEAMTEEAALPPEDISRVAAAFYGEPHYAGSSMRVVWGLGDSGCRRGQGC